MFIVKLGLKNLFRHKKRTIITAVVISLAIMIYLVTDSLMLGFQELSYNNIINLESGHIQLTTSKYWEEKERAPLENLPVITEEIKEKITSLENYQGMAEEVRFSARLNNGLDELPIIGIGIKPEQYREVFTTFNYLTEGSMFEMGEYQAVLGKSLADLMEVGVGDYITLLTRTKEGIFNTIDARISGLLKTPNPTVNGNLIYVPIDVAKQALNLEEEISQVVIRLKGEKEEALPPVKELNNYFAEEEINLRAYSWREAARIVLAMAKAQQTESSTVLGIILLIAAVGIINTTILSSLERMEEIGMMKALGMKEGEIIRAFMVEAAGIGVIGGLIGWALSALGVLYLKYIGISFSQLGGVEVDFGFPVMDKIYGDWNLAAFIFIFVFSVIIAVLASILPARWAARKDPVKAIYHR